VRRLRNTEKREKGQSIIEFALLLPLMVAMLMLLIQTEMAINVAIVGQKYTRSHLYHLFFNHPYYLELGFLKSKNGEIYGRMWTGMDSKVSPDQTVYPIPPQVKIGTVKIKNDDSVDNVEDSPEVKARQIVRIKMTSFTCSAPFGFKINFPFTEGNLEEDSFSSGGNRYRYCEK
jgi:hypothetical protein